MLGHRVTILLSEPPQTVSGELREQNALGVWIYTGWAERAAVVFYPARRILEIQDCGPVYR